MRDAAAHPELAGVIDLWTLDAGLPGALSADAVRRGEERGVGAAVHVIQALAALPQPARLWIVTRGANAVAPGDEPAVAQSPVWGLGRDLMLEHPECWGGLIDLDPAACRRTRQVRRRRHVLRRGER